MRRALLLTIGCTAAPAPAVIASHVAPRCDVAAWRAALACPWRARIGERDVIVVEREPAAVEIAEPLPGVVLGTRVSTRALAAVATRETALALSPGAPPVTVWIEPGFALPDRDSDDWLPAQRDVGIAIDGWVPASVRGQVWEVPRAVPAGRRLYAFEPLREVPDVAAPVIAQLTSDTEVTFGSDRGPPGWRHVTATRERIRVDGWIPPPQPAATPSSSHVSTYDFSDDVIEGDLVAPEPRSASPDVPVDTCVRSLPDADARVIGMVTGPVHTKPATSGWLELEVTSAWGRVRGYVRQP